MQHALAGANAYSQFFAADRLHHEIIRAGVHAFDVVGFLPLGGAENDVDVAVKGGSANPPAQVDSGQIGHQPIPDNEPDVVALQNLPRNLSIGGFKDGVAATSQKCRSDTS